MNKIKVSVITPVYNGLEYLEKYFDAVAKQSLDPSNFEVILVDNNSNDGTLESAEILIKGIKNWKVLSFTDAASSYQARNFGVSHALGKYLIFTDIDCIPCKSWLEDILEQLEKINTDVIIAGGIELFYKDQLPNVYEQFDYHYFLNQEAYAIEKTGATANLAVNRELFDSVGGFLEVVSGGDRDFCKRANLASNCTFVFLKNSLVLHPARYSYTELLKKIKRVSEGKAYLASKTNMKSQLVVFLKNTLACILQKKQFVEIVRFSKVKGNTTLDILNFSFLSLRLGFLSRYYIAKRIVLNWVYK